jgi:hypothetical protein
MAFAFYLGAFLLWLPFLLNRLNSGWSNLYMAPVILVLVVLVFSLTGAVMDEMDSDKPEGAEPIRQRIRRRIRRRRWPY